MFEGSHADPIISERLRQDMNPVVPRPVPPITRAAPAVSPSVKPAPTAPMEPATPAPAEDFVPQVETAPFVDKSAPRSLSFLGWIAIAFVLPSSIFWILSLLYVAGATAPLRAVVTTVPFFLIVTLNISLPAAAIITGSVMLAKTDFQEGGRLASKFAIALGGICLFALVVWLLAETL